MHVFVYGALMDEPELQQTGGPGWLDEHTTRFTARGFTWFEPRFLALEPETGSRAHGLVAEISEARWLQMSAHENGYTATEVQVHTATGPLDAVTLILDEAERVAPGLPSGRYGDRLVRGAVAVGLPPDVVDRYREAARLGTPITRRLSPVVETIRRILAAFGSR